MASIEELFAQMEGDSVYTDAHDVILVDPVARTLDIPDTELVLGVVGDIRALHPYFGDYASVKVCMKIDAKTQSSRILMRNGAALHERFINEWIPLENSYLKHFSISENCDIIINTD